MKKKDYPKSVVRLLEIAKEYHYCTRIVQVSRWSGYLELYDPFYRSPYPNIMYSDSRTLSFLKSLNQL